MRSGSELLSTMAIDGDAEFGGFCDRDVFLDRVDDKDDVRQAAHILDAAQSAFQFIAVAREFSSSFLVSLPALGLPAFRRARASA